MLQAPSSVAQVGFCSTALLWINGDTAGLCLPACQRVLIQRGLEAFNWNPACFHCKSILEL